MIRYLLTALGSMRTLEENKGFALSTIETVNRQTLVPDCNVTLETKDVQVGDKMNIEINLSVIEEASS